jgi:hypothetical protein
LVQVAVVQTCALPVSCYVREVTATRIVSVLLCERGYCHASYQRRGM